MYMYEQDLELNNLQWLIYHKIQPSKPNQPSKHRKTTSELALDLDTPLFYNLLQLEKKRKSEQAGF